MLLSFLLPFHLYNTINETDFFLLNCVYFYYQHNKEPVTPNIIYLVFFLIILYLRKLHALQCSDFIIIIKHCAIVSLGEKKLSFKKNKSFCAFCTIQHLILLNY